MKRTSEKFFALLCTVLLAAAVVLGLALDNTVDELNALYGKISAVDSRSSLHSRAPTPPAPPEIATFDLAAEAIVEHNLKPDAVELQRLYHSSRNAIVYMEIMGPGNRYPLHINRRGSEAAVVVSGSPEVVYCYRKGRQVGCEEDTYSQGDLIYHPVFCANKWINHSKTEMQANLVIRTSPFDGDLFVEKDDPRLIMGAEPIVFRPDAAMDELAAASSSFLTKNLDMMHGAISSLAVSGTARIPAHTDNMLLYAARGEGFIESGKRFPIGRNYLVIVPPDKPISVVAAEKNPLLLLVFRPSADPVSDILKTGKKRYSQNDEELIIREFFQDRKDGIFLDVGASHYMRDSTTYYLEKHLNWSGVAVDALGEYAEEYLQYRPRTRFLNYLVTDKPRGVQKYYRSAAYPEVSSTSKQTTQNQATVFRGDNRVRELKVPSTTLNELLDGLKIGKIDFLSMDIEEYEPVALAGFDIERFRPELVCIEAHGSVRDKILEYFHEHNYRRLDKFDPYDRFNWYFAPQKTD